jgi:hypothetical protein
VCEVMPAAETSDPDLRYDFASFDDTNHYAGHCVIVVVDGGKRNHVVRDFSSLGACGMDRSRSLGQFKLSPAEAASWCMANPRGKLFKTIRRQHLPCTKSRFNCRQDTPELTDSLINFVLPRFCCYVGKSSVSLVVTFIVQVQFVQAASTPTGKHFRSELGAAIPIAVFMICVSLCVVAALAEHQKTNEARRFKLREARSISWAVASSQKKSTMA